MKNFIRILPLVLVLFVSQAFAATGQHLQLRETKTKKIYNAKTDASGKFTFDKIEAGTYDLVWVLPEGTSPENTESASIEIQSFSWGVSNMGSHGGGGGGGAGKTVGTSTTKTDDDNDGAGEASRVTKTRSNIQNNRTINTTRDNIKGQSKSSDFKSSGGGTYYVVVLQDILVTGLTDCPGTVSAMAINEKGLPGEKKPKKSTK